MSLNNIYKPQNNRFSHLAGSDIDDDSDSDLYEEENRDFITPAVKPLIHSPKHRKPKVRRVRGQRCCGRSLLSMVLWTLFVVICIIALTLIILHVISTFTKDSSKSEKSKPKQLSFQTSDEPDDEGIVPCDQIHTTKVWHTTLPKLMTETAVRLNDVNDDGVDDIIVTFSTTVDSARTLKEACDILFNGTYPCFGGVLALDGLTGQELWRHYTNHEAFAVNCNGDLDRDGIMDCVIAGRVAVLEAVSGRTGQKLWSFDDERAKVEDMNVYTVQFVNDLNADGIMELVVAHGGDPFSEPGSVNRLTGRLMVVCGASGKVLRWVKVPDGRETYYSPVLYTQNDGTAMVVFGTGGETHPGGLWVVPLDDFFRGDMDSSEELYSDEYKGVMGPPALVDLNKDGTVDIVSAMFNTTVAAFDGETLKKIWEFSFPGSETYSSPAVGYFNRDNIPDFFVRYNYGPGFPTYFHSEVTILDGKTGQPIINPYYRSSVGSNPSPLTVSMEGHGNDLFIYWVADCMGHEGEGGEFEFVEGTNVHEQSRADTCKLRFNAKSYSKLYVMNRRTGFPGKDIYYSEAYKNLEHGLADHVVSSESLQPKSRRKPPIAGKKSRRRRHVGVPDHGGFQRLIASGALAPAIDNETGQEIENAVDVVFTTYWQLASTVRAILPEDRKCIEEYRKLGRAGRFDNRVDVEKNHRNGLKDEGDEATNVCLQKHQQDTDNSEHDHDYKVENINYAKLTVYRFRLRCNCTSVPDSAKCSRVLPMSSQGWGGYMGTFANGYFNERD